MPTKSQSFSNKSSLEGVLNLSKSSGPTSFSVVEAVRKILGVKKAGHIGTLDPAAEGVLPICLNRSTKISQFLTHLDKEYHATMLLGLETDSQDGQGNLVAKKNAHHITGECVNKVLSEFIGIVQQIPPMFSAKKRNGIPLYRLARNGITVNRGPISVNIFSIDFIHKVEDEVKLAVHCSSGTYIRTLCHDIGKRLGCGAHLKTLTRTRVGDFRLCNSITLEALAAKDRVKPLKEILIPSRDALKFLPEATIKEPFIEAVSHGKPIYKEFLKTLPNQFQPGMQVRILESNHELLAIAESLTDQDSFTKMKPETIAFKLKRVFN